MSDSRTNHSMPTDTASVTAHINSKIKVHITALDSRLDFEQPVYAINWFNSRSLWLYNFYNLLAAGPVLKVKGLPFFKGRVKRTLYGKEEDRRDVLLIVRYPKISHFKALLESRYFQFISIFRGLAVNFFTFGFSTRNDVNDLKDFEDKWNISTTKSYAVHHYRLNQTQESVSDNIKNEIKIEKKMKEIAKDFDVNIAFSSQTSARIYPQKHMNPPKAVDTIMDGCIILQANTEKDIEALVASKYYQELINRTKSSFVATLMRVF